MKAFVITGCMGGTAWSSGELLVGTVYRAECFPVSAPHVARSIALYRATRRTLGPSLSHRTNRAPWQAMDRWEDGSNMSLTAEDMSAGPVRDIRPIM